MKNRPKVGSKADAVLSTIEVLHEQGVTPVTRAQIYAACGLDDVDIDDVNSSCLYLVKQGWLTEDEQLTARISRTGPAQVKRFSLVVEEVAA